MINFKSALKSLGNIRLGGKLAKSIGYGTLFSVLFTFFLVMFLPLGRFIPNIENLLEQSLGRRVRIGDLATTITGGIVLSNLEIGMREDDDNEASKDDDDDAEEEGEKKPKTKKPTLSYLVDEASINLGFLSLLFGELDLSGQIEGLGGEISFAYVGAVPKGGKGAGDPTKLSHKKSLLNRRPQKSATVKDKSSKDDSQDDAVDEDDGDEAAEKDADDEPVSINLNVDEIALRQILDLRSALPVPLDGILSMEMNLASPTSGFDKASGVISFKIQNVVLSKKGYEASIMGSSLVVPVLQIESLEGEITFKDGVGKVSKFKTVSKYLDVGLAGTITLNDPIKNSLSDLYLTFTIKDRYLNESAAIKTLYSSIDTFSGSMRRAHRDDGYYGFRYRGRLGQGRFSPSKTFSMPGDKSDSASAKNGDKSRRKKRPLRKKTRTLPADRSVEKIPRNQPAASVPPAPAIPPVAPTMRPTHDNFPEPPMPPEPPFNEADNIRPPEMPRTRPHSPFNRREEEAEEEELPSHIRRRHGRPVMTDEEGEEGEQSEEEVTEPAEEEGEEEGEEVSEENGEEEGEEGEAEEGEQKAPSEDDEEAEEQADDDAEEAMIGIDDVSIFGDGVWGAGPSARDDESSPGR